MTTVRKSALLEALRHVGLNERADWVERAMPEDIDLQRNASLFDTLGIDARTLVEKHSKTADENG